MQVWFYKNLRNCIVLKSYKLSSSVPFITEGDGRISWLT